MSGPRGLFVYTSVPQLIDPESTMYMYLLPVGRLAIQ